MTISRRRLYAAGETLGDCITRVECGRLICGGGGGKSKSMSSNVSETITTTNVLDKRLVVDSGLGISADNSSISVNTLDAGIVKAALDTVKANDATAGAGFTKLLGLADKLFTTGSGLIDKTSTAALEAVTALNTAQNDKAGSIDQKTLVVLAAAGAVAAVGIWGKK